MSVLEISAVASAAFSFGQIDRDYLLYGVCLLFVLLVLIIVIRVGICRRMARRAAAAEQTPAAPLEQIPPAPASEPTDTVIDAAEKTPEASDAPHASVSMHSRTCRAVQLPDVVGEYGVAQLCPGEVVVEDGKLCMYCDVQVSVR